MPGLLSCLTLLDGLPFFELEDPEVDAMSVPALWDVSRLLLVWLLVFFIKDLSHTGV